MKTVLLGSLMLVSLASHASTISKADLKCEWTAFDFKTVQHDQRTFNVELKISEDGGSMVFKDRLSKIGLDSLEVQIVPQGDKLTMSSSISVGFYLRNNGEKYVKQSAYTFSSLSKKTMMVGLQAGSMQSEVRCEVVNIVKENP